MSEARRPIVHRQEIQKIDTIELTEAFLLKHGENIVDRVGAEIDRIERNLRVRANRVHRHHLSSSLLSVQKKHPSLRHVDLEVL